MNKIDNLADGLRQGMRNLASGVCVISGLGKDGEKAAMTASSVTSVSNDPPSLLVCINKSARMSEIMQNSDYFCVNILGSEQQDVSEVCATPSRTDERFEVGDWSVHEGCGVSYLEGSPSVFVCKTANVVEHGTHHIVIGNIEQVLVSEEKKPVLVYADGGYHFL